MRKELSAAKEGTPQAPDEAAEPGTPPVYGTGWANPHGLTWVHIRVFPTGRSMLISCTITSFLSVYREQLLPEDQYAPLRGDPTHEKIIMEDGGRVGFRNAKTLHIGGSPNLSPQGGPEG